MSSTAICSCPGWLFHGAVTHLLVCNRAAFLSCAALAGAAALASAVLYLRTRRWYGRLALRLRHA